MVFAPPPLAPPQKPQKTHQDLAISAPWRLPAPPRSALEQPRRTHPCRGFASSGPKSRPTGALSEQISPILAPPAPSRSKSRPFPPLARRAKPLSSKFRPFSHDLRRSTDVRSRTPVGPKVTVSYAMFVFRTASVDFRSLLRANVDHCRMTCEARPTCEVVRLASSEQLSRSSTVAVLRGSALGYW